MQDTAPTAQIQSATINEEALSRLWFFFASIPDTRGSQGIRYSLPIILMQTLCALCCGFDTYAALAQWSREYAAEIKLHAPCLANHYPDATTFFRVLSTLDVLALEKNLAIWVTGYTPVLDGEAVAVDGKTTAGNTLHLVAVIAHKLKSVLFQEGTTTKGKELVVAPKVLAQIDIKSKVVTADALHTHKPFCADIVARGGGYVLTVKDNQRLLKQDLEYYFKNLPADVAHPCYSQSEKSHGRFEKRMLIMSTDLNSYLKDWPGITHVFKLERLRDTKGVIQTETVYGIARLLPDFDTVKHLFDYIRGHWLIENRIHRQRDVMLHEDANTARKGKGPHVMSSLRNIVTTVFNQQPKVSFSYQQRHYAAHLPDLFAILGLSSAKRTVYC